MKIVKPILVMAMILFSLGSFVPVSYAQDVTAGIVIDQGTPLRKEPKTSSRAVGNLKIGEKIFIEDNHGKWYKVSTAHAVFGWVHSECVLIEEENRSPIENGVVNTEVTYLYENPNTGSQIAGELGFITKVTVVEKESDWYQLAMGDEIIGWVLSKDILITPIHKKAKVMGQNSKVKEEAKNSSKTITNLEKNHKVTIDHYEDGYFHIVWGENKEGWINTKEVGLIHEEYFNNPVMKRENKEEIVEETDEESVYKFEDIIGDATDLGPGYTATSYDLSIASCGKAIGAKYRGFTRSGYNLNNKSWEEAMVVAVDSRTIPLGSKLLILFDEGDWRSKYNGIYLAADTGGGVKGKTVDIYLGDIGNEQMQEVKDFGRADNVKVYLLN